MLRTRSFKNSVFGEMKQSCLADVCSNVNERRSIITTPRHFGRTLLVLLPLLLLLPAPPVTLSDEETLAVPASSALASWRRRFSPARMVATRASICFRSFSFS